MSDYRVSLDVYNGPLDLLLYLIKREEVDIYNIPISTIAREYIGYVELLQAMDPEAVGDFLVLAATLMEIKSRLLLPKPPPEELEEEDLADPRMELVRQLLEYKRFKDAAQHLEDAAEEHAQRFPRKPVTPPRDPEEVELDNLEIWDLFDAFNRLLEQTGRKNLVHQVEYDDTPISLHAEDIVDALQREGGLLRFDAVFAGRNRGELIGLFLALLELIKQKRVRASQEASTSPIHLHLTEPPEDDSPEYDDEPDTAPERSGPERSGPEVAEEPHRELAEPVDRPRGEPAEPAEGPRGELAEPPRGELAEPDPEAPIENPAGEAHSDPADHEDKPDETQ